MTTSENPNLAPSDAERLEALRERITESQKKRDSLMPQQDRGFNYAEYARRVNQEIGITTKFSETKSSARIQGELDAWHARIGERFANAIVEDQRIKERIDARIANMKKGIKHANSLVFIGNLGVGKTWNSYAYIEKMIREGLVANSEVFIGTESEVLKPITQAGYRQDEEQSKLLSRKHKVFFIDEVGRSKYRDAEARQSIWLMLVNHAYHYNLPLIITSNLRTEKRETKDVFDGSPKMTSEMEDWLGDAALDRLRYMTGNDGIIVPPNDNKRGRANSWFDAGRTNKDLEK